MLNIYSNKLFNLIDVIYYSYFSTNNFNCISLECRYFYRLDFIFELRIIMSLFLSSAFKEPIAYVSVSKDADCYNMNHKNRGICLIFNHEKFDLGYDKREGTSLDAKRLVVTFGNLGFDVEVYNDFTHNEIMDKIEKGKKRYIRKFFKTSKILKAIFTCFFFIYSKIQKTLRISHHLHSSL